jgi:hemerythrin superfamily protein
MNATQLLKHDHETIKRLFRDLERVRDSGKRKKQLFRQLRSEVDTHTKLEEDIFYPAVFEQAEGELAGLVGHAAEEHRKVKSLLGQISGLHPDDPRFDAKTRELQSCIEDHVEEEEEQMFAHARSTLGDQLLEQLGREIEERKVSLQQPLGQWLMGSVKAVLLGQSKGESTGTGKRAGTTTGRRAAVRSARAKAGAARKSRSAGKTRGAKRTERGTKQAARRVKGRGRATGSGQHAKGRAGQRATTRQRHSSGR